jgi:hypothetical protein
MMSTPDASAAPIRPADGARVGQTPPDFSWPDLSPDAEYTITLTYPDGRTRSQAAPQNWINWPEALPAGTFSWQVQARRANGTQRELSRMRRFTVAENAAPFLVPDAETLFKHATAKSHPRALPDAKTFATMRDRRPAGLAGLFAKVNRSLGEPLQSAPTGEAETAIEAKTYKELDGTLNVLFAYVASEQDELYAEALRRALHLASWDPRGSTSYANADQAARGIAVTLALAYDWLFPRLDAEQKRRLLDPLKIRVRDMYDDLIGSRARIATHPHDSHGNHTLTFLAAMSTVLAGEVPEAEAWLRDTLPLAVSWTSPWGGEDGGFANGTAYAQWVTGDCLMAWNILRWTVDVDLARKAWVRNYARFLAYFLPPGTPAGVFGDGAERRLDEQWARFGKAYALFAPSPLSRWYASQLTGEDISRLHLLLAPPGDLGPAPYPEGTADAALFPSIGWAAMHSRLSDPRRISVYFKSSPYGSFNHSHADQNSFIINSGGRALAIDSGYYDEYDTEHWRQWYKQTRAHNAVTFDGGQGQVVVEQSGTLGPGVITHFEHEAGYDIVSGDAAQAYGGAVTEARRTLVYIRPNLLLVHDKLASDIARRWEWNIHAFERIEVRGDGSVKIRSGDEILCVEMLDQPAVVFKQTNRFSGTPHGQGLPRQWHGAFVIREPSRTAEFIALLSVGCPVTAVAVDRSAGRRSLGFAGKSVILEEGRVEVRASPHAAR